MKFLKDLFTEIDGESFDITVVMGVGSLVIAWMLAAYMVFYQHKDFDIVAFATGTGALIAATGGAARLKPQSPIQTP